MDHPSAAAGGPDVRPDQSSDYGSELDSDAERELTDLLSDLSEQVRRAESSLAIEGLEDHEPPRAARVPRRRGQQWHPQRRAESQEPRVEVAVSVEDQLIGQPVLVASTVEEERTEPVPPEQAPDAGVPDTRSPLARFRTPPKKALSVTDLISPSWCELQYWYTLTKHGKKRRTPAMRQGSAVHKTLEEEVHRAVPVDVTTKEDAWGLRLWNIIQGLRTLRETGSTREIEVWGVVDGLVVNGVIDELSYACPDRELEEQQQQQQQQAVSSRPRKTDHVPLPVDQTSIDSFVLSPGAAAADPNTTPSTRSSSARRSKIYLTDVKTRSSRSLPAGASFRPTLMQLMIYHRLLADLASDKVDPFAIFNRYDLNAHAPFTDSFIAQVGNLNLDLDLDDVTPGSSAPTPDADADADALPILLSHNSLHQLWTLLAQAFRETFPAGAASVADVLKAEYRDPADGTVYGAKTFLHDADVLDRYLDDEMRWWRGEREPVGVAVEEAYKCRICEFADGCTWRVGKVEEATRRHRENARGGKAR